MQGQGRGRIDRRDAREARAHVRPRARDPARLRLVVPDIRDEILPALRPSHLDLSRLLQQGDVRARPRRQIPTGCDHARDPLSYPELPRPLHRQFLDQRACCQLSNHARADFRILVSRRNHGTNDEPMSRAVPAAERLGFSCLAQSQIGKCGSRLTNTVAEATDALTCAFLSFFASPKSATPFIPTTDGGVPMLCSAAV